ncbi:DUF4054 domain-containing protein [Aliarcobacter lanthieri]|uniref:DUF4054 domain-containing protein n=1 Tax=Aliarcobacter lanthieri TaxID=1355374 RepID=UPI003AA8FFD3
MNIEKFKQMYPNFSNIDDDIIEMLVDKAECYVSKSNCKCYEQLLFLVVAHLLYLREQQEQGNNNTSAIASATIDKVSISYQAPTSTSSMSQWFNLSPYGIEYLALNKRCNGMPRYIGGSLERQAFRKLR